MIMFASGFVLPRRVTFLQVEMMGQEGLRMVHNFEFEFGENSVILRRVLVVHLGRLFRSRVASSRLLLLQLDSLLANFYHQQHHKFHHFIDDRLDLFYNRGPYQGQAHSLDAESSTGTQHLRSHFGLASRARTTWTKKRRHPRDVADPPSPA